MPTLGSGAPPPGQSPGMASNRLASAQPRAPPIGRPAQSPAPRWPLAPSVQLQHLHRAPPVAGRAGSPEVVIPLPGPHISIT